MDVAEGAVVGGRLRRNRLIPGTELGDPGEVVAALCGVQAQDLTAAGLAIRARSIGLTEEGVEAARIHDPSFVRTWAMRGTLHLVASNDLRWLRRLLRPGLIRGAARRSAQLGLDEPAYRRATAMIQTALSGGGSLTRAQVSRELQRHGIDPSGQRAVYLLFRASVEGLICEGPLDDGKPSYVLTEDWLSGEPERAVDRKEDLIRLVSRYLAAYGPAGAQDLAAWSGLPLTECRSAFRLARGGLAEQSLGDRQLWTDKQPVSEPSSAGVRLLPAFDTFLLGYRNRQLHVEGRFASQVNAGGGMVKPVVLVHGRVQGTWRLVRRQGGLELTVRPFTNLPSPVESLVGKEVSDIARFVGKPASLTVEAPISPA